MGLNNSVNLQKEIDVALKEYDIMHQKVFANGKRIESQIIQLYLVTAGIFTICMPNYSSDNPNLSMLIDVLMIYLLPLLLFASIISTLVLELRTVYHGQYISAIEKRLNKLLGYKIGFDEKSPNNGPSDRIIDYERFRLFWGHRKRKFTTNADFFIFTVVYTVIVMPAAIIRLTSFYRSSGYYWVFGILILLGIVLTTQVLLAFIMENKKLKELVGSKDIIYDIEDTKSRP